MMSRDINGKVISAYSMLSRFLLEFQLFAISWMQQSSQNQLNLFPETGLGRKLHQKCKPVGSERVMVYK